MPDLGKSGSYTCHPSNIEILFGPKRLCGFRDRRMPSLNSKGAWSQVVHFDTTGLEDVAADLVAKGIDVVRVGYSDLIGTERGRDLLVNRFARTVGSGVAFCRSVYGTTPMGDVVEIEGGARSRPARRHRIPRHQHAPAGPVGAGRRARHRRRLQPGRLAVGREPADGAQASDRQVRRAGHATRSVGPELEFYVLERTTSNPTRVAALRRGHRQRLRRRPEGRPGERPAAVAAPAGRLRARGRRGQPRVLQRPVRDQPVARARRSTPPTAPSGSRAPSRSWPAKRTSWPPSWPSRSTTKVAPGFHIHFSTCDDDGNPLFDDPTVALRAVQARQVRHRRHTGPRPRAGRAVQPDHQLLQAVRPRHAGAVADRLGPGQPQRHGADPARARHGVPPGAAARRRQRQPLPGDRRAAGGRLPRHPRRAGAARAAGGLRLRPQQSGQAAGGPCLRPGCPRGRHRVRSRSSARSSATPSSPTSATSSNASATGSPTGSSASTPTTSNPTANRPSRAPTARTRQESPCRNSPPRSRSTTST